MCHTSLMGVLKCKKCCQVIEYRESNIIRCEKHHNKHQAARCAELDCTRDKKDDDTAAAFSPETYCLACQETTFKEKASEAAVAELVRSLDNNIDLGNIKSSFLPMTHDELERRTNMRNTKPSIFIPRKSKSPISNNATKQAETLVHQTAKGQITKASEKVKIQPKVPRSKVSQHALHDLLASMTVN